jgi:hypothetical protein
LAVQGQATPNNIEKDVMQFFIALAILVAGSSAYLLHQYWTRSLSVDDATRTDAAADADVQPSRLKAA